MTRRHAAATGLIALTTLVAGCGDDSHKAATPAASTTIAAATTEAATPTPTLGADAPGVIAFRRYTDPAQTTSAIFTIKPDGTGEQQVSHPPHGRIDDQPAISADGKRLAYEYCTNGSDGSCHVIVTDIAGGHAHEVRLRCPHGPVCDPQAPAWGPDGQLALVLAWGRLNADSSVERFQIAVVDADGSHPRIVETSPPYRTEFQRPVWSPDGTQIAYEQDKVRHGEDTAAAIAVVPSDGGHAKVITPWALGAGDGIDWSPDGKWIVFRTHAAQDGAPTELNVIHPDGTGRRALTHNGTSGNTVLSSSFSPDGDWIVFASQQQGEAADLYEMHTDGSDIRPLTQTKLWDSAPEWGRG